MGVVDRGSRGERHPRSEWPDRPSFRPRSRRPEPEPPVYYHRAPTPWATLVIAAACIAVFVYGAATGTERRLIEEWSYIPALMNYGASEAYLRLFTHMFLHDGWVHLLVNMICLYSFGRGLEPAMGTPRFALLYAVSGAAAALGHGYLSQLMDPSSGDVALVGASGAISGVFGAAAVAAPRMPVLLLVVPMPLYIAVVVLVALHVAAIVTDFEPGIAWWAHLVGVAAGALLYPVLRRRYAAGPGS